MTKKNKGKVHPSPSSSSSSQAVLERERDVLSVLRLLPYAILASVSLLPLQEQEALAYMITRSKNTSTNPNQNPISNSKKKSTQKPESSNSGRNPVSFTVSSHKVPIFDCDCFDCYTSYWSRWDSSTDRKLISEAIEAFEESLTNGKKRRGNKKRDKTGCPVGESPVLGGLGSPETGADAVVSRGIAGNVSLSGEGMEGNGEVSVNREIIVPAEETEDLPAIARSPAATGSSHKGLARKLLPDVLGILNSRLWSLWGPNV